jgi:uncharacterized membrane protein
VRGVSAAAVPEAIVGLLLVFFVPGYCLTKATFPEWRVRGPDGLRRLLEIGTLAFVLSLVLTVLVGALLLAVSPAGFQAYWSDPVLEAGLAAIAAVGFAIAWTRGAFARTPPAPHPLEPSGGEEGAWELSRELDRLARDERRLVHQLRSSPDSETPRLKAELERVRAESTELRNRREVEYAR